MICPVEIASDLSAWQAARVGEHGRHDLLQAGRDGADDEGTGSDFAGPGEEDHVVAGGRDHRNCFSERASRSRLQTKMTSTFLFRRSPRSIFKAGRSCLAPLWPLSRYRIDSQPRRSQYSFSSDSCITVSCSAVEHLT